MHFVNDGNNKTKILEIEDIDYDTREFLSIGELFEKKYSIIEVKVGQANTKFLPVKELIQSAIQYYNQL